MKSKWVFLVLGLLVLAIVLALLFIPRPKQEFEATSRIVRRVTCNFNNTQMPTLAYIPKGDAFRLYGEPRGCFFGFYYLGRNGSKAMIRVDETPLKYRIYTLEPGTFKYIQDGLYLHLIDTLATGARIALTHDGVYNASSYFDNIAACLQSESCKLACEDFNGIYVDKPEDCPRGTLPLTKTGFRHKFVEGDSICCLNYLSTPLVIPSKSVYYKDEFLKLYYIGVAFESPCDVYLLSPNGKRMGIGYSKCVSFRPIMNLNLLSNIGEEYGNWRAVVELHDPRAGEKRIEQTFEYKRAPLIYTDFKLGFNSSLTTNFLGTKYTIRHMGGCGNIVRLGLSINNHTSILTAEVGDTITIHKDVALIVTGAQCSAKVANIRLRKVAMPTCPNGFCEAGESRYRCPWDCLNNTASHSQPIEETEARCSDGCLYADKCLAEDFKHIIQGKLYECDNRQLKGVG